MKIYAVNGSFDHLLLVNGNTVVNGDYKVDLRQDNLGGHVIIPGHVPELCAWYVMDAPKTSTNDYNDILEEALIQMRGENLVPVAYK